MEEVIQQPQQPEQNSSPVSSPPVTQESLAPKSSSPILLYSGIVILVLVLLGIGGYFLVSRNNFNNPPITVPEPTTGQPASTNETTPILSPSVSPDVTSNTDQTLSNTDIGMQQIIDKVNIDLKDLNTVNTTQDNSNSL